MKCLVLIAVTLAMTAADTVHTTKAKELAVLLKKLMKDHDALPDKLPLDGGIKNVLPKF